MKTELPKTHLTVYDVHALVQPLRASGKTLITTNGCFDLLHPGHVQYLHDAAGYGDILVVGINSDVSVQKLKGPTRPVQSEHDRALIIGSIRAVDYVFIFSEPDPCTFLAVLKPDIHVKGGDYTPEGLPETPVVEQYGGKIVIVPFASGYSTTNIITTILSGL